MAVMLSERNIKKFEVFSTVEETILVFQQFSLILLKNLCGQQTSRCVQIAKCVGQNGNLLKYMQATSCKLNFSPLVAISLVSILNVLLLNLVEFQMLIYLSNLADHVLFF